MYIPETAKVNQAQGEVADEREAALKKTVYEFIRLVRTGSFIAVFEDTEGRQKLTALARSDSSWPAIVSRAILAETYDQVGLYRQAEEFATFEIGKQYLAQLQNDISHGNAKRDMVRAQAMLILQCAVSQLRRQSTQKHALALLDHTIGVIDKINNESELRSLHVRSLFYFWRGRLYSMQYNFNEAADDFQYALDVADQNLAEKLPDKIDEARRNEQVAAGNYTLSTCLGFGLGQLRQLEGKLVESLQYLRVAVPLSRGSVDFHRRGYAHLLIGIALRSRGRMDQHNNDLRAADEHLTEARRLLGGTEEKHLPHHLHLARVYHQLALSRYNRIGRNCEDLKEAEEMNNKAEEESNNEACKEHRDPVLDYGIAVARSLITTDLRNYVEARRSADSAIEMFPKLPRVTHGWAWVAKGMALAGALPDASSDYGEAERAFKQALSEEVRVTDRAAAHLHLALLYAKVGSTDKASIHYDRAIELVPQSEHGWIRDLAKRVEQTLGEKGMGYRCSFDVSELLRHANKDEGAWRYIEDFVSREIRSKLMRLMDSEIRDKGVPAVADELGIGQATLYLWLRQAGIKLDRPRKKTTSN